MDPLSFRNRLHGSVGLSRPVGLTVQDVKVEPVSSVGLFLGLPAITPARDEFIRSAHPSAFGQARGQATSNSNPFGQAMFKGRQGHLPKREQEPDGGSGSEGSSMTIRIPGKLLDLSAVIKILRQQLNQLTSRKEALEKETNVSQKAQEQKQQSLREIQTAQTPLVTSLKRLEQEHGKKLPDQVITVKVGKGRSKKR